LVLSPAEARARGLAVKQNGVRRSALELLGFSDLEPGAIVAAFPELAMVGRDALRQLECDARYAPYLARQALDVARVKRDEAVRLPEDLDYRSIGGLSGELREKLERVRPETLAQAGRIEGMTPAGLTVILMPVRQAQVARAAS
jgi:tRNA uridine 5-carboxymethylaminomethyl modification enzyme